MSIAFEMPLAIYQGFMGRCVLSSREYEILKNCVINHVPEYVRDGNVVEFLCKADDVNLILKHAKSFYPVAVSFIEEGIRKAIDPNTGSSETEYRKTADGDTWHFHAGCSHWPADDFILFNGVPDTSVCDECIVKARHVPTAKNS